eukprot:6472079-Prymnesium_polylepis.1
MCAAVRLVAGRTTAAVALRLANRRIARVARVAQRERAAVAARLWLSSGGVADGSARRSFSRRREVEARLWRWLRRCCGGVGVPKKVRSVGAECEQAAGRVRCQQCKCTRPRLESRSGGTGQHAH